MGTDVINNITLWENYNEIIEHPIIHFNRDNEDITVDLDLNITTLKSEVSLSSTFIRNKIKDGDTEGLKGLLTDGVLNFIRSNKYYL